MGMVKAGNAIETSCKVLQLLAIQLRSLPPSGTGGASNLREDQATNPGDNFGLMLIGMGVLFRQTYWVTLDNKPCSSC